VYRSPGRSGVYDLYSKGPDNTGDPARARN